MAGAAFVHRNGAWDELGPNAIFAKIGGVWRPVERVSGKSGGVWRHSHIRDSEGPYILTNIRTKWYNGKLRISWTNSPDSDFSHVKVTIYPAGQQAVQSVDVHGAPNADAFYDYSPVPYDKIYHVELSPYDTNGNLGTMIFDSSMQFTGSARGRTNETYQILATDSGVWRDDSFIGTELRPRQGASISGESVGVYYYGTQIWDRLRGAEITSASIELVRYNQGGLGGAVEPEMRYGTDGSKQGFPDYNVSIPKITGPGLCRNGACDPFAVVGLPSSWTGPMTDLDSSRFRSVVFDSDDVTLQSYIGNVSESYMYLYHAFERPYGTGIIPGRLNFNHTG